MCENHTHQHPHQAGYSYTRRRAEPALQRPLRIAIVGKGGAGKTTIAGALARTLAARGLRVLAIDADPDANLATVRDWIANHFEAQAWLDDPTARAFREARTALRKPAIVQEFASLPAGPRQAESVPSRPGR